jgi:hypothetical protein
MSDLKLISDIIDHMDQNISEYDKMYDVVVHDNIYHLTFKDKGGAHDDIRLIVEYSATSIIFRKLKVKVFGPNAFKRSRADDYQILVVEAAFWFPVFSKFKRFYKKCLKDATQKTMANQQAKFLNEFKTICTRFGDSILLGDSDVK